MPYIKYRTSGPTGVDTKFAAHVQSPPGTDIVQSAISGIAYTVREMVGPQQNVQTGSGSPSPSSSIFNTLQLTSDWTQDNTGYNFAVTIPGADFPDAGDYVVVFLLTPAGGGTAFPVEFFHHCYSLS